MKKYTLGLIAALLLSSPTYAAPLTEKLKASSNIQLKEIRDAGTYTKQAVFPASCYQKLTNDCIVLLYYIDKLHIFSLPSLKHITSIDIPYEREAMSSLVFQPDLNEVFFIARPKAEQEDENLPPPPYEIVSFSPKTMTFKTVYKPAADINYLMRIAGSTDLTFIEKGTTEDEVKRLNPATGQITTVIRGYDARIHSHYADIRSHGVFETVAQSASIPFLHSYDFANNTIIDAWYDPDTQDYRSNSHYFAPTQQYIIARKPYLPGETEWFITKPLSSEIDYKITSTTDNHGWFSEDIKRYFIIENAYIWTIDKLAIQKIDLPTFVYKKPNTDRNLFASYELDATCFSFEANDFTYVDVYCQSSSAKWTYLGQYKDYDSGPYRRIQFVTESSQSKSALIVNYIISNNHTPDDFNERIMVSKIFDAKTLKPILTKPLYNVIPLAENNFIGFNPKTFRIELWETWP